MSALCVCELVHSARLTTYLHSGLQYSFASCFVEVCVWKAPGTYHTCMYMTVQEALRKGPTFQDMTRHFYCTQSELLLTFLLCTCIISLQTLLMQCKCHSWPVPLSLTLTFHNQSSGSDDYDSSHHLLPPPSVPSIKKSLVILIIFSPSPSPLPCLFPLALNQEKPHILIIFIYVRLGINSQTAAPR